MIRSFVETNTKNFIQFCSAPFLIKSYLKKTPLRQRKLIVGGHWSNHSGWLILNQGHQDITKKLKLPNGSFEVIFLEHVFEHIGFIEAIFFLKEAKRILRKNGTIRIVAPFLEKIISVDLKDGNKKNKIYIKNALINLTYPDIDKHLKSIGLKGVEEDPNTFLFNGLFRENSHKFIWSAKLLQSVMKALGFKEVMIFQPGVGHNKEYSIERKQRGIYTGTDWQIDIKGKKVFDPESLVVEGIK